MKQIYFVTFDTKDSVNVNHFFMHVMANTAKEAIQEAKKIWTENGFRFHQYKLYAHKSRIQNIKYLKIISWTGETYREHDAMEWPYCIGYDKR